MHINEFRFMKRKNLGNYEHEEVTMAASVDESDNVVEVALFVKQEVYRALGEVYVSNVEVAAKSDTAFNKEELPFKVPATKKAAKKAPRKKAAKKVAGKQNVSSVQHESGDDNGVSRETPTNNKGQNNASERNGDKGRLGHDGVKVTAATLEDVRKNLSQVWKSEGKGVAFGILENFGAKKSEELTPDVYTEVIDKCQQVLA